MNRVKFITTGAATVLGLVALPTYMERPQTSRVRVDNRSAGRKFNGETVINGQRCQVHFHYQCGAVEPFRLNPEIVTPGDRLCDLSEVIIVDREVVEQFPLTIWDAMVLPC